MIIFNKKYKIANNGISDLIESYTNFSLIQSFFLDILDKFNKNINNIINNIDIHNLIVDNIISIYTQEIGKNLVMKGVDNIIFQITDTKSELELLKNMSGNNINLSIIDLGECENILREKYEIRDNDYLIILKNQNISNKITEKNIKFEVYDPYNKTKLNLSICDNVTINIYIPLELSEDIKNIYENMKKSGYDMFNISDPFYQDICTPYDSPNGTDILLSDRINYIYNNDETQCQPNCYLSHYSVESKFINCTCSTNNDLINVDNNKDDKFDAKTLYKSFYDVLRYSNYKILICFNLIFNKKILKKNVGGIIIISFAICHTICLFSYIIKRLSSLNDKLKKELNDIKRKIGSINLNHPIKRKINSNKKAQTIIFKKSRREFKKNDRKMKKKEQ